MAFWNRKKKEEEKRSGEILGYYSDSLLFGSNVRENNAMCLSAVYRATDLISDSIAVLPIGVKDDKAHKDVEHPLNKWFRFGSLLSKYNTMKLLIQSVILKGNGFAVLCRDNKGNITDIQYVECGRVVIDYNEYSRRLVYRVSGYKNAIEPCNMIHLVKESYDGVNGMSVLKFASRTLNTANATENSAKDFFSNGCNLAGIIKVEGQLSDKQKNDIRNSWAQTYAEGGKGVAVLQGNMSYQSIQSNANDSQLLESRVYNVQDIARFFGISPVLLGDLTHASYSTLEAVQLDFLQHTLQPFVNMVEEEFNRKLLKPSEMNLRIDLDTTYLLKADKNATASYYNTLLNNGILCIDEARKELGYEPIGLTEHFVAYTDINQNKINGGENE